MTSRASPLSPEGYAPVSVIRSIVPRIEASTCDRPGGGLRGERTRRMPLTDSPGVCETSVPAWCARAACPGQIGVL